MLTGCELREKIKVYLQDVDSFSLSQLKDQLAQNGCIYNIDYNSGIFSNAISALVRKKYIVSLDNGKKGDYKVIKKEMFDSENITIKKSQKNERSNPESELKIMRKKIKSCLLETCTKIETLLDSEKASTYGRNMITYGDILRLIEQLKSFEFTIKDK